MRENVNLCFLLGVFFNCVLLCLAEFQACERLKFLFMFSVSQERKCTPGIFVWLVPRLVPHWALAGFYFSTTGRPVTCEKETALLGEGWVGLWIYLVTWSPKSVRCPTLHTSRISSNENVWAMLRAVSVSPLPRLLWQVVLVSHTIFFIGN